MFGSVWLDHYPSDVPEKISVDAFASLNEVFANACQRFSDRAAVSCFGQALTFSELDQHSRDFASYLQSQGFQKGERLAMMLPNVLAYYVAMLGALRAGLVIVNCNPLYTPTELQHPLQDSEAAAIVVLANFAHVVTQIQATTALREIIIVEMGDLLTPWRAMAYNVYVHYIQRRVQPYDRQKTAKFLDALKKGRALPCHAPSINLQDTAFLQYTGGTTGVSKAAVLTHGNLIANILQICAWVEGQQVLSDSEIALIPLPLYHIFSLTVGAWCFLHKGFTSVLITDPRHLSAWVRQARKTPFSILIGVNTLFAALLREPAFQRFPFAHLKLVVGGGAPVTKTTAEEWFKLTGNRIVEGYGLTEASPVVTVNPLKSSEFTGSIGMPLPSTDLIVRDQDRDLPPYQYGEILVKGPQVMREYWRNPTETAAVFTTDGWLRTGDIGYYDDQGFFYVVDRIKDMILVSGFNVYPAEIEAVLLENPKIQAVAVIGVPDEHSGEAVKAVVVKRDPTLSSTEIQAFCRQRLTGYKRPHYIEFVDALPLSPIGKVLKRQLRQSSKGESV